MTLPFYCDCSIVTLGEQADSCGNLMSQQEPDCPSQLSIGWKQPVAFPAAALSDCDLSLGTKAISRNLLLILQAIGQISANHFMCRIEPPRRNMGEDHIDRHPVAASFRAILAFYFSSAGSFPSETSLRAS